MSENASYPTLAEMGIVRFHEISHYSLRQDGLDKDVLRIIYKRAKGSFLPYSRKYKFGRSLKTVVADGGTARMEHSYEISPFLLKAVAELDKLVDINKHDSSKSSNTELAADVLTELNELESMVKASDAEAAAIAAKFESIRKHIDAL
ncbi:DUF3461 family protein [Granulosicoccus sp. 3-233]|uniref:DUF3461 family protein n=1 Tax=Granulosicoccus sp. 3-233 TaxID=3417969 RepID=UPI003D358F68